MKFEVGYYKVRYGPKWTMGKFHDALQGLIQKGKL